jgi:hypothetical protein
MQIFYIHSPIPVWPEIRKNLRIRFAILNIEIWSGRYNALISKSRRGASSIRPGV